jgi:hypothetical protein
MYLLMIAYNKLNILYKILKKYFLKNKIEFLEILEKQAFEG